MGLFSFFRRKVSRTLDTVYIISNDIHTQRNAGAGKL